MWCGQNPQTYPQGGLTYSGPGKCKLLHIGVHWWFLERKGWPKTCCSNHYFPVPGHLSFNVRTRELSHSSGNVYCILMTHTIPPPQPLLSFNCLWSHPPRTWPGLSDCPLYNELAEHQFSSSTLKHSIYFRIGVQFISYLKGDRRIRITDVEKKETWKISKVESHFCLHLFFSDLWLFMWKIEAFKI